MTAPLPLSGLQNLSGAGATDINAFQRTLNRLALLCTATSDLAVSAFVRLLQSFASIPYPYFFKCSKEREVSSTLGDMLSSGYYAWDTQEMVERGSIECSAEVEAVHTDSDTDVTKVVTVTAEAVPDNAETAVQLTEFRVANNRHSDLLVKANLK